MRKKHDEGYALVFVLVVMTVLSALAIALMSGALRNLQAQNAAIERMEDKYVAEGMIEAAVSELLHGMPSKNVFGTFQTKESIDSDFYKLIDQAIDIKVQEISQNAEYTDQIVKKLEARLKDGGWGFDDKENGERTVVLTATYGTMIVQCELVLEKVILHTPGLGDGSQDKWEYAKPISYRYNSYAVSNVGGVTG